MHYPVMLSGRNGVADVQLGDSCAKIGSNKLSAIPWFPFSRTILKIGPLKIHKPIFSRSWVQ